jgi:hypothetical protein
MGEGSEWIAASEGSGGLGSSKAHHFGISPQKDRGGTAGEVGESQGGEEGGCLKVDSMKKSKLDWKT